MTPKPAAHYARHPIFDRVLDVSIIRPGTLWAAYCPRYPNAEEDPYKCTAAAVAFYTRVEGRVQVRYRQPKGYSPVEVKVQSTTLVAAIAEVALTGLTCPDCGGPVPFTTIVTEEAI